MPPIDGVSDELLLYIFRIHVWRNQDTPHRLLRVSKRWYGVTTGNGSLWGNIIIAEPGKNRGVMHKDKILCSNEQSLKLALERTGSSPFELTILGSRASVPRFGEWDSVQSTISQRCRALMLYNDDCLSHRGITNLTALEWLVIDELPEDPERINHLITIIARTSKRLQRLDIDTFDDVSISPYFEIMSRLKSFQILAEDIIGVEKLVMLRAPGLEQLCLHSPGQTVPIRLDATFPVLQRLRISEPDFDKIPWSQYTRLTHLWLYIKSNFDSTVIFTLPTLVHLTLEQNWSVLACINAPNLESLALQRIQRDYTLGSLALEATALHPRSLDIDVEVGAENIIRILRGKWQDIEILRLLSKREDGIGQPLLDAFTSGESFCSNLVELVVVCVMSIQQTIGHQLTKIVAATREKDLFQRIRYGTFHVPNSRLRSTSLPLRIHDEMMTWTNVMARDAYNTPSFRHSHSCYDGCHREAVIQNSSNSQ